MKVIFWQKGIKSFVHSRCYQLVFLLLLTGCTQKQIFDENRSVYFLNDFDPKGSMWFEHILEQQNGDVRLYGYDSTRKNIVTALVLNNQTRVSVTKEPFIDKKFGELDNYTNGFKLTYVNSENSIFVMNRYGSFIKKLSFEGNTELDFDLNTSGDFGDNLNTMPFILPDGGIIYATKKSDYDVKEPFELIQLDKNGEFIRKLYLSMITLDFMPRTVEILDFVEDDYVTLYGACNRNDGSDQVKTYVAVFNLQTAREIKSLIINENERTTIEGPHLAHKSPNGIVILLAPNTSPFADFYNPTFKINEMDMKGENLWQTDVDIDALRVVPWHMSKTPDNGWLVVGWCIQGDSNTDKPFVVKVDKNGKMVFSKVFTIGNFSRFHVGKQLQNGDLFFAGTTLALGNSASADFFTLRTNSKGEYLNVE